MSDFPAIVRVADLDGTDGFTIHGFNTFEYSGTGIFSRDVDGDGIDDILIGAPGNQVNNPNAGAVYVIYGSKSVFPPDISLFGLDPDVGHVISGATAFDALGLAIGAEDVNGDGFNDLLFAAPGRSQSDQGMLYVLFGTADGVPDYHGIPKLDGTNGFTISGYDGFGNLGQRIVSAGDINGDGCDDIMLAKYIGIASPRVRMYVVFGHEGPSAPDINVNNLNGTNGFTLIGPQIQDHTFGNAMASCDLNGDGFKDVIVGAWNGSEDGTYQHRHGVIYVVYGQAAPMAPIIVANDLNGINGFKITDVHFGAPGMSLDSAGDVNGDGIEDLLSGADGVVLFGSRDGFAPLTDIGELEPNAGLHLISPDYGNVTRAVSSAGDVNGDGFSDIMTFGYGGDGGRIYVFFGGPHLPDSIKFSNLDGQNGFQVILPLKNYGSPVFTNGDVNGDGFSDLVIGAPGAANYGTRSGSTYVVYGQKPGEAVIRLGTAASQTLGGGDFSDTLFAGDGADRLVGNGGDDVLRGGLGPDTLAGGAGRDVFAFGALGELQGDVIADFLPGTDLIDLSSLGALTFHGQGVFTHMPGEVRFTWAGADTLVLIDVNGDGFEDATLRLSGHVVLDGQSFVGPGGPQLASAMPADGGVLAIDGDVVLTFDREVLRGSGAIEVHRGDGALFERIAVDDASRVAIAGSTVTIDPFGDMAAGTGYYLLIGGQTFVDAGGHAFAGIVDPAALEFVTAGVADTTAPTLIGITPSDGATGVTPNGDIVLTFNEYVRAGVGNLLVHQATTISPIGADEIVASYQIGDANQVVISGNQVTIHPHDGLAIGRDYYITLDGGVITDSAGNEFAGIVDPAAWNFTIGGVVDSKGPSLTAIVPGPAPTNTITLTFNERIQLRKGFTADGISIMPSPNHGDGPPVKLMTFDLDDAEHVRIAGKDLILTLPRALQPGTGYSLFVNHAAIMDMSGNYSTGHSGSSHPDFTTAGIADTTAPTLVSTSPAVGNVDVPIGAKIVVTFSEVIQADPASIHGIAMIRTSTGKFFETIHYDNPTQCTIVGNQMFLDPIKDFDTSSAYDVILTDGIVDLSGNRWDIMLQTISFTTVATDTAPHTFDGTRHNDNLTGAEGADTFFLEDGGNDKIFGKGGDDTFLLGGALSQADLLDAGGGNDTVVLSGDYSTGLELAAGTLRSFENVVFESGNSYRLTTHNATVAAGATLMIDGSKLGASNTLTFDGALENGGRFDVRGGAGNDSITLGKASADVVMSGKGDDTILAGGGFGADDRFDGGGGYDTLVLNGDYGFGVSLAADTLLRIEAVKLVAGYSYQLVFNDGNARAGATLSIDASSLHPVDAFTFDGSVELDASFVIAGGAGHDVLLGGAGQDQISGGRGADLLKGGLGADRFLYKAAAESSSTGHDTITALDFAVDKIDLLRKVKAVALAGSGSISDATFDADIAGLSMTLGKYCVKLLNANAGSLTGQTFLVIDTNGVAGYQAGQDLVLHLDAAQNIGSLSTTSFV